HNAVGVNLLYFNDFYSALSGGLVGWQAHPTAFLFQKLGFAGVSFRQPEIVSYLKFEKETNACRNKHNDYG
ncbi:MAG: hypothetical protein J5680_03300, partial [Neisseriaceae bacterium]|nr:hypothetical protein [Neisseriaceae bacterium]